MSIKHGADLAKGLPRVFYFNFLKERLMKIRNILKTFGIVCMLFVIAAMPTISAFAAGAHAPGVQEAGASEFPPEYAFILGLIATAIVWGVNLFYRKQGTKISRKKLTVVLFGVGLILAALFNAFTFPSFPGWPQFVPAEDVAESTGLFVVFLGQILVVVFTYLASLLTKATAMTGSATIIYNLLKDKIFPQLPDVLDETEAPSISSYDE